MRQWLAQRRRLRIRFGVSAGVFGVSVVGLALFVVFPRCSGEEESVCAPPVRAIVSGVAVAASLVSTVVSHDRCVDVDAVGFDAHEEAIRAANQALPCDAEILERRACEVLHGLGEAIHVTVVRFDPCIEIAGGAHEAVGGQGEAADHEMLNAGRR